MFMGSVAFAYYFPVLDKYLRSVPSGDNEDDSDAWIIGRGVISQFSPAIADHVIHLADDILNLAEYVCHNIDRFGDSNEQNRASKTWQEVSSTIKSRLGE